MDFQRPLVVKVSLVMLWIEFTQHEMVRLDSDLVSPGGVVPQLFPLQ